MKNLLKDKEISVQHHVVEDFMECYPNPAIVKQKLWELLIAAMGSEHADIWDRKTRADQLFFYEQMSRFMEEIYKRVL